MRVKPPPLFCQSRAWVSLQAEARSLNFPLKEQVENEYGFCGHSKGYLRNLIGLARKTFGDDTIVFTTDPPSIVDAGSIPGDEVYT